MSSSPDRLPVLAFGAHPDDIEFGCGGVIAQETRSGRAAHLVVCSRGEAATHGRPGERVAEAQRAAALLGASIEFVELDGDSHLEMRATHAITLAGVLRRVRPGAVLAPSLSENQHPDHSRLGRLVRDAARLARYGGLHELDAWPPHRIEQLLFYGLTTESEPDDAPPLLIDISAREIVAAWVAAMEAHASQASARNYVDMQLARARVRGLSAGVEYAVALFPADPLVYPSLSAVGRGARGF
jgi:LmbE family N-acetylglucosaminyl deacetylase